MCDSCGCPSAGDQIYSHSHDGEGSVHTHGTAAGRTVDVHASLFAANDALAGSTGTTSTTSVPSSST